MSLNDDKTPAEIIQELIAWKTVCNGNYYIDSISKYLINIEWAYIFKSASQNNRIRYLWKFSLKQVTQINRKGQK